MESGISTVFFDLDDTLIDRSAEHPRWPEFTHPHHRRVYDLLRRDHELPAWGRYLAALESARARLWSDRVHAPTVEKLVRRVLVDVGVDAGDVSGDDILRAYDWRPVPGVRPFPDAAPTLDELARRGYGLGLVTNSSEPMWMRDIELEEYGLLGFFPRCRVASSEVGYLKPSPQPFDEALRVLGVRDAATALFVGDRLESDIEGADRLGLRTALLMGPNTVGDPARADHQLDRLSDLLMLLP